MSRPKTAVLGEADRAALFKVLQGEGESRLVAKLELSPQTILRALSGSPVQRATKKQLLSYLSVFAAGSAGQPTESDKADARFADVARRTRGTARP